MEETQREYTSHRVQVLEQDNTAKAVPDTARIPRAPTGYARVAREVIYPYSNIWFSFYDVRHDFVSNREKNTLRWQILLN